MSFSVVNSSGPMPALPPQRRRARARPRAGVGRRLEGRARPHDERGRDPERDDQPSVVGRSTTRLGRNARASCSRGSRRDCGLGHGCVSSPVPRTITTRRFLARPSAVVFGATGSVWPWAKTLTRPSGKFDGRLLLEPLLDGEGALLGELHVRVGACPALSVWPWISTIVPLATTRSLNSVLSSAGVCGRELGAAGGELDVPGAAADDLLDLLLGRRTWADRPSWSAPPRRRAPSRSDVSRICSTG